MFQIQQEIWFICRYYHCKKINTYKKKGISEYVLGEVLSNCTKNCSLNTLVIILLGNT